MNIEELQAAWRLTHIDRIIGQISARELERHRTSVGSTLIMVDQDDRHHLLFEISDDRLVTEDKRSVGIHLKDAVWGLEGQNRRFVDLVCLKSHLNDVFDLMILDVFDTLTEHNPAPDGAARDVIDRWRELLEEIKPVSRSAASLVGLYGELWTLRELVRLDSRAVNLWRGPHGDRYDFYNGAAALEVKTTQSRQGKRAVIHGHDQLADPPNGNLYLQFIQVETGEAATEAVRDVILNLSQMGGDMRLLYLALSKAGFSNELIDEYSALRFNVLHTAMYLVDDNFPRITSDSFVSKSIPPGVVTLNYTIELSSVPPYPLDANEQERILTQLVGGIR